MKNKLIMISMVALALVACNKKSPAPITDNINADSITADTIVPETAVCELIPNAVIDIDGNTYNAVKIGEQVWMAENLRTTRYANGTTIPSGKTESDREPYRYAPDNRESIVALCGYLYNWPAVMNGAESSWEKPSGVQGICPDGWHVPSMPEWEQLTKYVGSWDQYACGNHNSYIAKSLASTDGWILCVDNCDPGNEPNRNNATGFNALPAGLYYSGNSCDNFGRWACFWTASDNGGYGTISYNIYYDNSLVGDNGSNYAFNGFSVRCVKD